MLARFVRATRAHRLITLVSAVLALQRHFSASNKFAHVESRVCGRERQGKEVLYAPVYLCARKHVHISVVVGLVHGNFGELHPQIPLAVVSQPRAVNLHISGHHASERE